MDQWINLETMFRKTFPALLLVLACTGPIQAMQVVSPNKAPHWSAEKKAARLTTRQIRVLHLSPEQSRRIYTVNQLYGKQLDGLRAETRQEKSSQMEKLKSIRQQRDEGYRQILDAHQYKHWNDMEIRQKEKLKAYRTRRRDRILAAQSFNPPANPDGQNPAP